MNWKVFSMPKFIDGGWVVLVNENNQNGNKLERHVFQSEQDAKDWMRKQVITEVIDEC